MNALLLWFHRTGSPPNFDRFCARWVPWCFVAAVVLLLPGLYGALFAVPTDYKQGDSFRILYIHVPAAWSAMFIFVAMSVQAFIALVWRIKACETLAVAAAPGASCSGATAGTATPASHEAGASANDKPACTEAASRKVLCQPAR